jgi:hypothetical protein
MPEAVSGAAGLERPETFGLRYATACCDYDSVTGPEGPAYLRSSLLCGVGCQRVRQPAFWESFMPRKLLFSRELWSSVLGNQAAGGRKNKVGADQSTRRVSPP